MAHSVRQFARGLVLARANVLRMLDQLCEETDIGVSAWEIPAAPHLARRIVAKDLEIA
jgi:hypothetical protein